MGKQQSKLNMSLLHRWLGALTGGSTTEDAPSRAKKTKERDKSARRQPGRMQSARKQTEAALFEFEQRLREMPSSHPTIASGKMQVLNIEPVARNIGENWPKVAGRTHLKIEKILSKHLRSQDLFRQHDDYIYVVVFADTGGADARAIMAMIGKEIERTLLGEQQTNDVLELRTATIDAGGGVSFETYSLSEAMAQFLENNETASTDDIPDQALPGVAASHETGAIPATAKNDKLDQIARAHEMIPARLNTFETAPPDGSPKAIEFEMLRDLDEELFRLHDRLARHVPLVAKTISAPSEARKSCADDDTSNFPRAITVLLMEAENAFMAGREDERIFLDEEEDLRLSFEYRPLWYVKKRILSGYLIMARLRDGDIERPLYASLGGRRSEDINALVDRCHLRRALLDIEMQRGELDSFVGIPIHFSTLRHTAHRQTIQYLLHTIPQWCRSRIIWEVVDTPIEPMRAHIDDTVSLLSSFGGNVGWHANPNMSSLKALRNSPVKLVGINLRQIKGGEERAFAFMDSWVEAAEEYGMKTYFRGADTRSLALAGVCAGAVWIAGDGIAAPVPNLKGLIPYSEEQLYAKIISEVFS